ASVQLFDLETAGIISRLIFFSIQLTVTTWILFTLYFTGTRRLIGNTALIVFLAGNLFIQTGAIAGWVSPAVIFQEGVFRPVYGWLHLPFVVFNGLTILFYLYIMRQGLKLHEYNEIMQFQIRYHLKWVASAALFIFVFNGVFPAFLNYNRLAIVGPFAFLLVYWSSLHLLVNHKTLYLQSVVRGMRKEIEYYDNVLGVRRLLYSIKQIINSAGGQPRDESLSFATGRGLEMAHVRMQANADKMSEDDSLWQRIDSAYLADLARNSMQLKADNMKLALALEQARQLLPAPERLQVPDASFHYHRSLEALMENLYDPADPWDRVEALNYIDIEDFNWLLANGYIVEVSENRFRVADKNRSHESFVEKA
ncbi:MAG: hypothetical protein KDK27_18690, partial [Leptospiraceae bacterium]|nr:hypothetical protein [Leptospiraceae bacterium]